MIFIDPESSKIKNAKAVFIEKMRPLLEKRIEKYSINLSNLDKIFLKNLNLEEILGGMPDILIELNSKINTHLTESIKQIFNYNWFISQKEKWYDAYDLAKALDINTCIYCSRSYTHTVIKKDGKKITRPQFDHYFEKENFPLLALSFYNLIPCCAICNSSIKKSKEFRLSSHFHPYLDKLNDHYVFSYQYQNKDEKNLKIKIKPLDDENAKRTLEDLETELLFNTHISELKDMIDLRYKFSDNYLKILSENTYDGIKFNQNELYRLAFGTELEKDDFINRPLSKFKNDILKELGII